MQKLNLPIKSLVSSIRPNSDSLRTAIPQSIAQMLKLEAGDSLIWDFEVVESQVIIKLRKGKKGG